MKKNELDQTNGDLASGEAKARRPYSPPRIEKRQPVARVTLLSGMGATSVGVISMMN
jgi:hypothetical protein